MRKVLKFACAAVLAFAVGIHTSSVAAEAQEEKPSAYDEFAAKEMKDFRSFVQGLSDVTDQEARRKQIEQYAEKLIGRYAEFRDGEKGAPYREQVNRDIVMISLNLMGDVKRVEKLIESQKKPEDKAQLRLYAAQQLVRQDQDLAKKWVETVLKQTKSEHPEIHAEAQRVLFQIDPVGRPFPEFQEGTKDLEGEPIRIADYEGKVVLVDFWAAWCGPCRAEMPNVVKTYEEYHPKGFEIIGISLDNSKEDMQDALKEYGMTWRQYFDGKGWENEVSQAYGVSAIPATYLVGPKGKVVGHNLRGPRLEEAVQKHVAEDAGE